MLSAQEISDHLKAKKKDTSWSDGATGSLDATGVLDKDSDLYQKYLSLPEDTGSTVDDLDGYRAINKDAPPKTAEEYNDYVQNLAKQGFDVRTQDMDGDFTHSNIAIKPSDFTGDDEVGPTTEVTSKPLAKARASIEAFDDTILLRTGDAIFGSAPGEMNKNYLDAYKLNLAQHLKPKSSDGSERSSQLSHIKEEEQAVAGVDVDDDVFA